jgi:CheY-like chemotaxis protein
MNKVRILWTDDEIDLLKPHILFLQEKGYKVITASNGQDAIRLSKESRFDVIFLDEHMPGLSGLETLEVIKKDDPTVPVVIITKSEEENIMDQAIGSKIADYLIKPVNPKQILLSIKKILDNKRLVSQKITQSYQTAFRDLGILINEAGTFSHWIEIYKRLVFWDIEMEESGAREMREVLRLQHAEANKGFVRFIKGNYAGWFDSEGKDKPLLSTGIIRQYLLPLLDQGKKVVFLLIDNMRYDQWRVIYSLIQEYYLLDSEELYYSILPTATQYARNAIFAGLMPKEISELFQVLWVDEEEETSKNLHEEALLKKQFSRLGKNIAFRYDKVNNLAVGNKLLDTVKDMLSFDLSVVVYNFVDILSHARTEIDVIREIANDEAAYRSITRSWFVHSPLYELVKSLSRMGIYLVITTDHGSVRVQNPVRVIGDKQTSTNLRYKQGRNLNYNPKEVFEIKDPAQVHLPRVNVSTKYIFAGYNDFFAYPNNFNYYVGYYKNTFQHGGISMEEMLIPVTILAPKPR